LRVAVMHEGASGVSPEMSALELIVDTAVARLAVVALVDRHDGQDRRAGKMLAPSRPSGVRGRPVQNRLEVPHGLEERHRVRHQRQSGIEVGVTGDLSAEGQNAAALLEDARRRSERLDRAAIEAAKPPSQAR